MQCFKKKILAEGRKLRAGSVAETGDAAAAAHGCRDRLLELCCLLLRSLCGAHPSAPYRIAAMSFETTVTTVTTRHKHVSFLSSGGGGKKHRVVGCDSGGGSKNYGDGAKGTSWSRAAVGHAIRAAGAVGRRWSSRESQTQGQTQGQGQRQEGQNNATSTSNDKSYFSTTSKGGLGVTTTVTTVVTTTLGDALMQLIEAGLRVNGATVNSIAGVRGCLGIHPCIEKKNSDDDLHFFYPPSRTPPPPHQNKTPFLSTHILRMRRVGGRGRRRLPAHCVRYSRALLVFCSRPCFQDKEGSAALRGAAAALYEELCDRGGSDRSGDGGKFPGQSAETLLGGKRALAAVTLMAGFRGSRFRIQGV